MDGGSWIRVDRQWVRDLEHERPRKGQAMKARFKDPYEAAQYIERLEAECDDLQDERDRWKQEAEIRRERKVLAQQQEQRIIALETENTQLREKSEDEYNNLAQGYALLELERDRLREALEKIHKSADDAVYDDMLITTQKALGYILVQALKALEGIE